MKRHDLGKNFHEIEFNNTFRTMMLTEPLWGVGTTPTYGHDGRSQNLEEEVAESGGQRVSDEY